MALLILVAGALGALLLEERTGDEPATVANETAPATSWSKYLSLLQDEALSATLIADRWKRAAEEAILHAVPIEPPYREAVSIGPEEEWAIGLRVELRRGQSVVLSIDGNGEAIGETLFIDVLEVDQQYGGFATPVYWSRSHTTGRGEALRFLAQRDGSYLLRLQAEPLREVSFTLEAERRPGYLFPVEGASSRDIWSVFGDSRGGGRRIHHGIDIFARRGTIVRAATDAYVARVGTRSLGGRIVTLYDQDRDIYLYYAHLDDWLVEEGTFVRAGDPIGTVGNTGNARYTPPHLHLGLYDGWWSRPIDPWNFFVPGDGRPESGQALQLAALGERRALGAGVEAQVFVHGVPRTEILAEEREVRVIGVSEEGARVVMEDGIPALVSPEQLR